MWSHPRWFWMWALRIWCCSQVHHQDIGSVHAKPTSPFFIAAFAGRCDIRNNHYITPAQYYESLLYLNQSFPNKTIFLCKTCVRATPLNLGLNILEKINLKNSGRTHLTTTINVIAISIQATGPFDLPAPLWTSSQQCTRHSKLVQLNFCGADTMCHLNAEVQMRWRH